MLDDSLELAKSLELEKSPELTKASSQIYLGLIRAKRCAHPSC
ncbi:hypothetical protein GCHA_4548 [Paraglaciecola chathamensis S18K6]|uniref:Uncharacterized protein n=1 Tax=Paraglaciecola chathamensis S18K6 TaxID=1127672 RepID=A0AAV3V889_9ALTE|nr:hypothetical protein GCHA_4548 [Paraglaciecola chathamensis S18K6]